MAYIKPPPPLDDEVIFTDTSGKDYTWGEHRKMEKMLAELERTDSSVRKAREKLDIRLAEFGIQQYGPTILICEHCGEQEFKLHKENCLDYYKDLPVVREAGGYQYLDDRFRIIHTTSVHCNDEEALDYFRIVALMFPSDSDFHVKYIMRREMHETTYKMLPYQYDPETKEVTPIERPGT